MHKVIVTGGSSFVGYHLAIKLSNVGYNVIATGSKCSDLYAGIQKDRIKSLMNNNVKFETIDILNKEKTKEFINKYLPHIWFHLPAWTSDWGSFDFDLGKAFELNILPLQYIFKNLSKVGCIGFIQVGSDAEYSSGKAMRKESDPCYPNMPYGFSKLIQTVRVKQLAYQYNLVTRVGRVFTPFGKYENPIKLIPQVLAAFENNEPLHLSSCEQQRDYIFIDDLVDGFEKLIHDFERNQLFEVFNISCGIPTRLKTLLLELVRLTGNDKNILRFGKKNMKEGEPFSIYGDNQKAKKILNWEPDDPITRLPKFLDQLESSK